MGKRFVPDLNLPYDRLRKDEGPHRSIAGAKRQPLRSAEQWFRWRERFPATGEDAGSGKVMVAGHDIPLQQDDSLRMWGGNLCPTDRTRAEWSSSASSLRHPAPARPDGDAWALC